MKLAYEVFLQVLEATICSDMDVLPRETRRILAHKEDRKLFFDAVHKLRTTDEVTIVLHTGEELTLVN